MRRSSRAEMGHETVRILEEGGYRLSDDRWVDIAADLQQCQEGTRLLTPEDLASLAAHPPQGSADMSCLLEIQNESTLAGIRRLLGGGPVAALNFASARNPGGGFLSGAQAQEESLARSSGLYASLTRVPEFYERHRHNPSLLYSDSLILSPRCPVFRDDAGALLPEVHHVSFISGAAPNAGALQRQRSSELELIASTLHRRIEQVLALAAAQGYRQLVLGAWGCGVFRNDPMQVAASFATLLRGGWERYFSRVLFAVLDPTPPGQTIAAFRAALQRTR